MPATLHILVLIFKQIPPITIIIEETGELENRKDVLQENPQKPHLLCFVKKERLSEGSNVQVSLQSPPALLQHNPKQKGEYACRYILGLKGLP